MHFIKKDIADNLSEILGIDVETRDIETSEGEHGDFSYPAMKASSELGMAPRDVGERVTEEFDMDAVERIEVAGPGFVNFFLKPEKFAEKVEKTIKSENMGVEEREGRALVEFSSPNVAKPMHVGHFRNTVLGDSIQRMLEFAGYDTVSENYIGDWGTQYGKLVYAYKNFGSREELEENPMEHLFELYVKFHKKMDDDVELEEKGREWASKIEKKEGEAYELWKKFREESIKYHKNDYARMGIEFDRWTGESTMLEETENALQEGIDKGVIQKDPDGSLYVEFDDYPTTILRKADGTTLYLSRDIANLKKRKMEQGFDLNLYIVGSEQNLHFKQLFNMCERMDLDTDGCEHISYGLLKLKEGSMSSRKGRIVRLSDVLDKAVEKAEEKIESEEAMKNAEEIGIGAVKYANLSVTRNKDIEFDWDSVLTFEGDSGPYIQYSNTRAKSILRKTGKKGSFDGEFEDKEYRLLKKISEFPAKVENAVNQREPAKIANYLSELCERFNSFYHECPVKDADEDDKNRRIAVTDLFVDVTDQGMELLGIVPLESM